MANGDNEPIFWVGNHHVPESGKPPHIDGDIRKRYHAYFENEYGEQAIFIYDYEVGEGTLWLGDAGWERSYRVVNGEVPELMLGQNDRDWLKICWETAGIRGEKQ